MLRALAALLLLTVPAVAEPSFLVYQPIPAHGPEAVDSWTKELPGTVAPLVVEARSAGFVATQLFDRTRCPSFDLCPTRIFEGGIGVFDGEACTTFEFHAIDPETRTFYACGRQWKLDDGGGDE